jgi:uncharacterized protein with FMN-binding domain
MRSAIWVLAVCLLGPSTLWGRDEVEFHSGAKVSGKVTEIRKDEKEFEFELQLGGRTMVRTYSYSKVHAVTINGKRYVLSESASDAQRIMLAECYWRLGSNKLAGEILSAKRLPLSAIKLLGDMGQTDRALRLADAFGKNSRPHEAFLLAGDACRQAKRYDQAINYYQKVIDAPEARNEDYGRRFRGRAADSIRAIRLFEQADVGNVANGAYTATSVGYNGDVEVAVTVKNGRIQDVTVTRHNEKQFYAALTDTTSQIVDKQSVREVDGTSGATISSQAIVNATAKALATGAK